MFMKRSLALATVLTFLFSLTAYADGDGTLDQAASPTGAGPAGKMYSLTAIYNRLQSGTAASKGSGFTEPSAGPASGVMYTLNNILDDFNTDATATSGTLAADVLAGKTFFATSGTTRLTDWGPVAGTMTDRTGTDVASTAQAAAAGTNYFTAAQGYYDGTARVSATDAQVAALDADIAAGNIKDTVTIFGVLGTYSGGGGGGGLPRTGQTAVYRAGDDGTYQKGVPAAPGAQFTNNGDGTVTDNGTGLIWASDGNGVGCNSGATIGWNGAIDWAEALSFATQNDWRLPNIKELVSIVDYSRFVPAIDTAFFPNTKSDRYWSSTTIAGYTGLAWGVGFYGGFVSYNDKTVAYYVRAVRGGQ